MPNLVIYVYLCLKILCFISCTADEIAAVFCASKKSLAAGAPMAALIFGANPGLGLILLPIMIYHPLQLIVCSVMAENYATRNREEAAAQSPAIVPAR